jgi:hypothetical protein
MGKGCRCPSSVSVTGRFRRTDANGLPKLRSADQGEQGSKWTRCAIHPLTFVEVKARATAADLDFAIDERRLARVAAAAEYLMPRYAGPGDDIRIDVILLAPGTRPRHIENAWIG